MTGAARVVLTGCSSGGKSTLLDALAARGHRCVPEPGRRIVRRALAGQGGALPWEDGAGFARDCLRLAATDLAEIDGVAGPVVFDRSALDAAIWLERHALPVPDWAAPVLAMRISHVLLVPPWPELRITDGERRGSWDEAVAEYESLAAGYAARGHAPVVLERTSVAARAAAVERMMGV